MIRQVTLEDYEQIKSIKNEVGIDRSQLTNPDYKFRLENHGFLLFPEYELTDFTQDLHKIFLVYEEGESIVGYIRVDTEPELATEGNVQWLREDMKPYYFAHPHADLGGIAVSPSAHKKGIGSLLLKAVERELRKDNAPYLFSFIVTSPIKNTPSILFHKKNGFEQIAVINSPENFGLNNYQSFLYAKKLNKKY